MRLVLEVFGEEEFAVGQMVLPAGGLRGEGGLDAFGVRHFQGTIHFVGTDVVEAFAFVALRQALPIELGSLEEREGAHDVGLSEGEGVLDAAVHVALSGKVDNAVDMLALHEGVDGVKIANVGTDEGVVGLILDVLQVGEVAGVCQFVDIDDVILGVFVHEKTDDVAADEARSASDDDSILHLRFDNLRITISKLPSKIIAFSE